MKKLFTLNLLLGFFYISFAQPLPNLPIPIGSGNAEVWNNEIYLFGGADDWSGSNMYPRIYKFNGTSWAYYDSIPDNYVWDAETVLAGDFTYLFGGWNGGGSLNRKYNLNSHQWTSLANSPVEFQDYGLTAEVLNGIIYLFSDEGVFAYNISTNTWTTKNSLSLGVEALNSVLYQNEIYIVGWGDLVFYKYTPATDQWTQLANPPYVVNACGFGVVNNLIYCIGGNGTGNSGAEYKNIALYNITTNSWATAPFELSSKRHWMATAEYKGGLYVIGGFDENGFAVDIVEQIVPQGTSDVSNESEIPDNYYLKQNYPNPFNPSTKISYSIPELSFITLRVYDVLGNEIATLVNEEKTTGSYEVDFVATDLPSGVYFYQLKAGSFVETKKMVLMK
jgi:N-acetylneuraminic acid mutarotase